MTEITVPLPVETVRFIDEQCEILGMGRSEYLTMLLDVDSADDGYRVNLASIAL